VADELPEPDVPDPFDPLGVNPPRPPDARADRPGIHIQPPAPTDEEWRHRAYESMQIEQVLVQVRYLFRVAYRPRSDAAYPHLFDLMMAWRPSLQSRAAGGDVMAVHQLAEIDHFVRPR
jgi:hypothetical protein